MSTRSTLTDEQLEGIRSLRRYLINASKITEIYVEVTGSGSISDDFSAKSKNWKSLYHGNVLLFVWLGSLNSVIEGWFALRLRDDSLEKLVGTSGKKAKQVTNLKDFRDRTFHFYAKEDPLHIDFIYDPENLKWAMKVNLEFEKWFDYYFTANTMPRGTPGYEWFSHEKQGRA